MTLPLQNFVDRVTTVMAVWLNEVDIKRSLLQFNAAGNLLVGVEQPLYTKLQQARSNTTTMADDGYLVWNNMPAGAYRIRGMLQFQGSVTGTQGLKFAVNVGGTITGNSYLTFLGVANAAQVNPQLGTSGINTTVSLANISTTVDTDFINFEGIVTTTTVGEISLQWAQSTSSANASVLNDRSWMSVTPFA